MGALFGAATLWTSVSREESTRRSEFVLLVTGECAAELQKTILGMWDPDQPEFRLERFSHLPRELDHFAGYAVVTVTNGSTHAATVPDAIETAYRRCSSNLAVQLDIHEPNFGQILQAILEHRRDIGDQHTNVRLSGDRLEVFGADPRLGI
jgi:hypothetical protein